MHILYDTNQSSVVIYLNTTDIAQAVVDAQENARKIGVQTVTSEIVKNWTITWSFFVCQLNKLNIFALFANTKLSCFTKSFANSENNQLAFAHKEISDL